MPVYSYTAISRTGRQIRDAVEASSLETAKSSLRGAGYTILEIRAQSALNRDIELPFFDRPTAKDMAIFCRQFGSILRAGVSVSVVLSMLGQQTENKKLAAAIREMLADIEKGETLARAMGRHPEIFNKIMVNMVMAGEESGNLENSFRQMEAFYEKTRHTRSAVVRAMIYPCILAVVMLIVLFVMMTRIIPQFLQTFQEMGAELPRVTRYVMAVSGWFVDWGWLLLILFPALIAAGALFGRTGRGKRFFGFLARKLPVVGPLTVRSACAVLCRTLSLLLGSGLTLMEGLELAAANINNVCFREAAYTVRRLVSVGWPLSAGLREVRLFPPMVCNLTSVGEETGDLQGMLGKAADYYDEEVEETTKKLLALLEPAVVLFMAALVIILVFSIFLPVLNMTHMYDQYL